MITIVSLIILILILMLTMFKSIRTNDFSDYKKVIAMSSIGIILLFVPSFMAFFVGEKDPNLTEDVVYEIYSINDNIEVGGSFCLGTGKIQSQDYYYFYIKTDMGLKVEKLNAENVYIQETDEEPPKVVYQYHKYIYPEWYDKFISLDRNANDGKKIVIKVPSNTVTKQYTLDLK